MSKPCKYGYTHSDTVKMQGLAIDPDREGHKGRWIIYRDGPEERGCARALCSTEDPYVAQWVAQRLAVAEEHEPWARAVPSRGMH